jgi:glycosyltransferase involved in cell wall biosynthesis
MSFDSSRYKDHNVLETYMEKMGKCFAVIATNRKLYNIAKTVNPNVFLIPNGIDLIQWAPRPYRKFNLARPVIGFCGNVVHKSNAEYKGYGILKEATRRVGLDVKEALFRTRQIPHDQMMRRFYWRIDILVHPTAGVGCSNTLMEALACGVPVITTRCAGYHGEMLEDGKNVVFCDRTAESIELSIRRFLKHPDMMEQIGAAGREFAEKHHDINDIAAQYREVFCACAENGKN